MTTKTKKTAKTPTKTSKRSKAPAKKAGSAKPEEKVVKKALPKVVKKAPKELSRRQQIRAMVDSKGEEAAMALGEKLGLPEGTTYLYVKDWIRLRAFANKKVDGDAGEKLDHRFNPDFRFDNATAARRSADSKAKLSGLKSETFVIAKQGSKFAIVPAFLAEKFTIVAPAS